MAALSFPELWYQGTIHRDAVWSVPVPRAPWTVWEVLLVHIPLPIWLAYIYLPNAGRKTGGRDWWEAGFPETGT